MEKGPLEERDIAAESPEVVARLRQAYEGWFPDVTGERGFAPPRIVIDGVHVLRGRAMTEDELRFDLALGLYVDEKVTLGQAAQVAGMSTPAFLDELGKRKIPVH